MNRTECKLCKDTKKENFYKNRTKICKECYKKKIRDERKNKNEEKAEETLEERVDFLETMAKSFFSLTVEEKKHWDLWKEEMEQGVIHFVKTVDPKIEKLEEENTKLKRKIRELEYNLISVNNKVAEICELINKKKI